MVESMLTDWFYAKGGALGGQRVGPLTWDQLYSAARSGDFEPSDPVWHPSLPEWLQAASVPGLFAEAASTHPQGAAARIAADGRSTTLADHAAGRPEGTSPSRPAWLLPVIILVAVVIVVGGGLGSYLAFWKDPGNGGDGNVSASNDVPTSIAPTTSTTNGWPMVGPTVIDVPTEEISASIVSSDGAVIEAGPVRVDIPPGAVTTDTGIVVTRLNAPFHTDPSPVDDPDAVAAVPISSAYDFGPAGVSFAEPVTITLPYDLGFGPQEVDPDQIGVAYFDGERWMAAVGTADPLTRTVSVQLPAFEGTLLNAVLFGTGVGILAQKAVKWYYGPEGVESDHVIEGEAGKWITPKDPEVQKRAAEATIWNSTTKETKSLDDPDLATWVADSVKVGETPTLVYKNPDGTFTGSTFNKNKGSNWQEPSHYFNTGTEEAGPVSGDCTDTTNAAVSVLIAKGFRAKGVYGYAGGDKYRPHAWGEVLIGDKVYRIDESGGLVTADNSAFHFTEYRPVTDPADPHYNSMWDDDGQKPYDEDWWKASKFAGTYKGTIVSSSSGREAPWDFTIDDQGNVKGGYDVYWDFIKVQEAGLVEGRVSDTGEITASGVATATYEGGTQTAEITLTGQISGVTFKGVMATSDGKEHPATATRQ